MVEITYLLRDPEAGAERVKWNVQQKILCITLYTNVILIKNNARLYFLIMTKKVSYFPYLKMYLYIYISVIYTFNKWINNNVGIMKHFYFSFFNSYSKLKHLQNYTN